MPSLPIAMLEKFKRVIQAIDELESKSGANQYYFSDQDLRRLEEGTDEFLRLIEDMLRGS